MPIQPTQIVDEVMRRWPVTIGLFLRHRMLCPGCPFAGFHTIEDACQEHDVPLEAFLLAVEDAIQATTAAD